jgi:hypothetical protein
MTSTQLFDPSWSRLNIWPATLHIQILPLKSSLLATSGFVLLKNEFLVPWQSRYLFYAFALCRLLSLFYPCNFCTLHWSGVWVKDFFIACACINFFANWKMFSLFGLWQGLSGKNQLFLLNCWLDDFIRLLSKSTPKPAKLLDS